MFQYGSSLILTVLAAIYSDVVVMVVDAVPAASSTAVSDSYSSTAIDGGDKDGWDEQGWYVQNDGVMGGKSQGSLEFIDVTNTMKFSGTIVTQGGGFTSVRRKTKLDLSKYAGIVVTVEAEPYSLNDDGTTSAVTGMHLQFDDTTSYYAYSSAFAIPLTSTTTATGADTERQTTTTTSVYLPMDSFDRGTRMGYVCKNNCGLNAAAIDQLSLYMLFQEGTFDVRVLSITAVEEPVAFPSPLVIFNTYQDVIALIQATILSGGNLYDKSYIELCIAMYWSVLNSIIAATPTSSTTNVVVPNSVKAVICAGLNTMITTTDSSKKDKAWTLRYIMEAVMDDLMGTERDYNSNWLPSLQDVDDVSSSSLCLARTSAAAGVMVTPTLQEPTTTNNEETNCTNSEGKFRKDPTKKKKISCTKLRKKKKKEKKSLCNKYIAVNTNCPSICKKKQCTTSSGR